MEHGLFIGKSTGNIFMLRNSKLTYLRIVDDSDERYVEGATFPQGCFSKDYVPYCGPVDSELLQNILKYA